MIHFDVMDFLELLVGCGHEQEPCGNKELVRHSSEDKKNLNTDEVMRRTHEGGQMAECVNNRNSRIFMDWTIERDGSVAVSVAIHRGRKSFNVRDDEANLN